MWHLGSQRLPRSRFPNENFQVFNKLLLGDGRLQQYARAMKSLTMSAEMIEVVSADTYNYNQLQRFEHAGYSHRIWERLRQGPLRCDYQVRTDENYPGRQLAHNIEAIQTPQDPLEFPYAEPASLWCSSYRDD